MTTAPPMLELGGHVAHPAEPRKMSCRSMADEGERHTLHNQGIRLGCPLSDVRCESVFLQHEVPKNRETPVVPTTGAFFD